MIRALLNLYILVLILDTIFSYLPQWKHYPAVRYIHKASRITCDPIKKYLPQDLPFDFSPLVVVVLIKMVELLW